MKQIKMVVLPASILRRNRVQSDVVALVDPGKLPPVADVVFHCDKFVRIYQRISKTRFNVEQWRTD